MRSACNTLPSIVIISSCHLLLFFFPFSSLNILSFASKTSPKSYMIIHMFKYFDLIFFFFFAIILLGRFTFPDKHRLMSFIKNSTYHGKANTPHICVCFASGVGVISVLKQMQDTDFVFNLSYRT